MIPQLHEKTDDILEIDYLHPIAYLADAISCKVTENLNKDYTLELKYPVGGANWEDIRVGRLIVAKANEKDEATDPTQPFTITEISRDIGGNITVKAEHISYRLEWVTVPPISGHTLNTVAAVRDYLNSHALNNRFTFYGDGSDEVDTGLDSDIPKTAKEIILSGSNSVIATFAAKMRYSRDHVAMETDAGDSGDLIVRYGVNMVSLQEQSKICSIPSLIHPYVRMQNASNEQVYIDRSDASRFTTKWNSPVSPRPYVKVSSLNTDCQPVNVVDLTDAMQRTLRWNSQPETAEAVLANEIWFNNAAYTWARENIEAAVLPPSITLKYVDLGRTAEYSNLQINPVGIGDIITIQVPHLGIDTEREVVGVVYDVLNDANESITVGSTKETFTTYLARMLQEAKQ